MFSTLEYNLKIIDYGFSSNKISNETMRGSKSYMAPEIIEGKLYHGSSVDIFAIGVVLYSLCTAS